MNQALLLNLAIVAAAIVCMVVLHNPLGLFVLMLLKDLPYGLMLPAAEEPEEESKPIGFIQ